jgi:hypothetical protein
VAQEKTPVQLSVFRDQHQVDSLDKFRTLLGHRHEQRYGAFWLAEKEEGGPALAMFINGDRAMFYFRTEGDTGFHSLGPAPDDFQGEVDFLIENHQLDRYPRAMVVPRSQAVAAFEEFYSNRCSTVRG